MKNVGTVDSKAAAKAKDIRIKYEKKLTTMQKELSKLQSAKREHGRLIKSKVGDGKVLLHCQGVKWSVKFDLIEAGYKWRKI